MLGLNRKKNSGSNIITSVLGLVLATSVVAGPKEQANKMYNRITGVPPTPAILDQMTALITDGKAKDAAIIAMQNPSFLNITVFDMFTSFSNEDENNRVELNDYIATAIGLVRDDANFKDALTADVLYVAPAATPAWSTNDNLMYTTLQTGTLDFSAALVKTTQTAVIKPSLTVVDPSAANFTDFAGLLTTRGFAVAYYIDGTNRAALRFAGKTFLCRENLQMLDNTRPDLRIRQDVTRKPGGNSTVFRNKCAGCHTGMDPLAGAFAYMNSTEVTVNNVTFTQYQVTPGKVQKKYYINAENFPDGYVTKDDGWQNFWVEGPNKAIGWNGAAAGNGVRSFGQLYADTNAFSECMAKRTYARVCVQDPLTEAGPHIEKLTKAFIDGGYKMKNIFAEAATMCMGN
jgi:hypothetical protein